MAEAQEIHGTVFKSGSATLLARVVGATGLTIVRADITSIKHSIHLLDERDPDAQTPVAGHVDVPLAVNDVIFNALQLDTLWTKDDQGYNFKHQLDASTQPAFTIAGRAYRVLYELTPAAGPKILVRFRVHVI